jgi:hypothetical protein
VLGTHVLVVVCVVVVDCVLVVVLPGFCARAGVDKKAAATAVARTRVFIDTHSSAV